MNNKYIDRLEHYILSCKDNIKITNYKEDVEYWKVNIEALELAIKLIKNKELIKWYFQKNQQKKIYLIV